MHGNYTDEEWEVVRWSLEELAKLPYDHEDFTGWNVEECPPTIPVRKVR